MVFIVAMNFFPSVANGFYVLYAAGGPLKGQRTKRVKVHKGGSGDSLGH
jgi:hypothetical protein